MLYLGALKAFSWVSYVSRAQQEVTQLIVFCLNRFTIIVDRYRHYCRKCQRPTLCNFLRWQQAWIGDNAQDLSGRDKGMQDDVTGKGRGRLLARRRAAGCPAADPQSTAPPPNLFKIDLVKPFHQEISALGVQCQIFSRYCRLSFRHNDIINYLSRINSVL